MTIQKAHDLPAMSWQHIHNVQKIESWAKNEPQVQLPVQHVFHAGMYARTVRVPAGVMITGALIKIPTILIVSGDCGIYLGGEFARVIGQRVFSAAAGRKQIFIARKATDLTMCFPTDAKTVKEAEEQFTDEAHMLQNREV